MATKKTVKTSQEVKEPTPQTNGYLTEIQRLYFTVWQQELKEELQYSSVMEVPQLVKIVLNMGVKEAPSDSKAVEGAANDLAKITGQKALITKAKKAIAAFKLREGLAIGCKVTLRGQKMYDFFEKLVKISLPRVRDFRGVSAKFDGKGNLTFGVKEQIIFPEIKYEETKVRGLDITIVTTAKDDRAALALLQKMGFPFSK